MNCRSTNLHTTLISYIRDLRNANIGCSRFGLPQCREHNPRGVLQIGGCVVHMNVNRAGEGASNPLPPSVGPIITILAMCCEFPVRGSCRRICIRALKENTIDNFLSRFKAKNLTKGLRIALILNLRIIKGKATHHFFFITRTAFLCT